MGKYSVDRVKSQPHSIPSTLFNPLSLPSPACDSAHPHPLSYPHPHLRVTLPSPTSPLPSFSHSFNSLCKTNTPFFLSLFLFFFLFLSLDFICCSSSLWALTRGPIVVVVFSHVAEEGLPLPQVLQIVQGGAAGGGRRNCRRRGRGRRRRWGVVEWE